MTGNPQFRFTLSHDINGTLEISEPIGWVNAVLKLERHEDFHSLIEYFDGAFTFYGSDGGNINGGIDWIKSTELQFGFDTTINILIEVSFDEGDTFEEIFSGQLDLTGAQELKDNKMEIPIIRNSLWSNFIARQDVPVNIQSATDLDGNSVTPVPSVDLNLKNQIIKYYGNYVREESSFTVVDLGFPYGIQMEWDKTIINDFNTLKFSLPPCGFSLGLSDDNLVIGNFEAPWNGVFHIESQVISSCFIIGSPNAWVAHSSDFIYRIRKIGSNTYEDGVNTVQTVGGNSYLKSYINTEINLVKGDQVAIYGVMQNFDRTIFGSRRLTWKTQPKVATTRNYTLSGEQIVDGVLTSNTRVLVRMQASKEDNGIYITNAGAWTRATDADTANELNNAAVQIDPSGGGTTTANTCWRQLNTINALGTDQIEWYNIPSGIEAILPYNGSPVDTYLRIVSDTSFRDSSCETFLLHDSAFGICDRITGQQNSFYSEILGSDQTIRNYSSNGCLWEFIITQGLQLRGYYLSTKQMSMPFSKWWQGANPIFNLGISYDTINGVEVIRCENKEFFYDKSSVSVYIDNVREIIREYDATRIWNQFEFGYKKWESEDISGIDDPQSKRIYTDVIKKIKNTFSQYSEFIAASLAIETTRRVTIQQSKDYKFDNDIFIIAIEAIVNSPDNYDPELNENFNSVTNLFNPETRYNLSLTPMRNLLRWGNFIAGSLQTYPTSSFKFASGEGNYAMTSDYDFNTGEECIGVIDGVISERDNIAVSNFDFIHLPNLFTITIDLSWDDYLAIRNNRTKSIGVSQTETGHKKFFIKTLEYTICKSEAKITMWATEMSQIDVIETVANSQNCDSILRITEDGQLRITENGINRRI